MVWETVFAGLKTFTKCDSEWDDLRPIGCPQEVPISEAFCQDCGEYLVQSLTEKEGRHSLMFTLLLFKGLR